MPYVVLRDSIDRVRFKHMQAPDFISDMNGLVFMTLFGPPQAIRACWANIVKKRKERTPTRTNVEIMEGPWSKRVKVTPGQFRYHMTSIMVDERQGLAILRYDMDRLNTEYVLGGTETEPSPWFEFALGQIPTVPYRKEWLPILWQRGIKDNLIKEVEGQRTGLRVWRVVTSETLQTRWHTLLKQLIGEGVFYGAS